MPKFKNFLSSENLRNEQGSKTFDRFLRRAVGPDLEVLCAHHIIYVVDGEEPNEIPSADTLLFSPELMGAVFGKDRAIPIMLTLAHRTPELRERVLADFLDELDLKDKMAVAAADPKTGSILPVVVDPHNG